MGSSVLDDFSAMENAWFTGAIVPVYGYYQSNFGASMVTGLGEVLDSLIGKREFTDRTLLISIGQMNKYCEVAKAINAQTYDIKPKNMVEIDGEIRLIDIGNKSAVTPGITGSCYQKVARALIQAYLRAEISWFPDNIKKNMTPVYEKYSTRQLCHKYKLPNCDDIESFDEFYATLSDDSKAKILINGNKTFGAWNFEMTYPVVRKFNNSINWSAEYFDNKNKIGEVLCRDVSISPKYEKFKKYCIDNEKYSPTDFQRGVFKYKFNADLFATNNNEFQSWIMEIFKPHIDEEIKSLFLNKDHDVNHDQAVFNLIISEMPDNNLKTWFRGLNDRQY